MQVICSFARVTVSEQEACRAAALLDNISTQGSTNFNISTFQLNADSLALTNLNGRSAAFTGLAHAAAAHLLVC